MQIKYIFPLLSLFLVASCGVSSSGSGNGGGQETGNGDTQTTNPVVGNTETCNLDKSFCVKSDELPSQINPYKSVKMCPVNTILIDDLCQELIYEVIGDKNTMSLKIKGATNQTVLRGIEVKFDNQLSKWKNSEEENKYIDSSFDYSWYNIINYNFKFIIRKSGYTISATGLSNSSNENLYDKYDKIYPKIILGNLEYDSKNYSYDSFENWCNSLNNELQKFRFENGNPNFKIKITNDNYGKYVSCKFDNANSSPPLISGYNVTFYCDVNDKNKCIFYDARTF
ncbi:MAG: hypothetical protein K2X69_13000 [Silvanigrellaceae bacterium]|nr:hypothetical protein [Silvanigrellaceae bacterium]